MVEKKFFNVYERVFFEGDLFVSHQIKLFSLDEM